eukprot:6211737-Pleurochrysis_carterae.AAC.2
MSNHFVANRSTAPLHSYWRAIDATSTSGARRSGPRQGVACGVRSAAQYCTGPRLLSSCCALDMDSYPMRLDEHAIHSACSNRESRYIVEYVPYVPRCTSTHACSSRSMLRLARVPVLVPSRLHCSDLGVRGAGVGLAWRVVCAGRGVRRAPHRSGQHSGL